MNYYAIRTDGYKVTIPEHVRDVMKLSLHEQPIPYYIPVCPGVLAEHTCGNTPLEAITRVINESSRSYECIGDLQDYLLIDMNGDMTTERIKIVATELMAVHPEGCEP